MSDSLVWPSQVVAFASQAYKKRMFTHPEQTLQADSLQHCCGRDMHLDILV